MSFAALTMSMHSQFQGPASRLLQVRHRRGATAAHRATFACALPVTMRRASLAAVTVLAAMLLAFVPGAPAARLDAMHQGALH